MASEGFTSSRTAWHDAQRVHCYSLSAVLYHPLTLLEAFDFPSVTSKIEIKAVRKIELFTKVIIFFSYKILLTVKMKQNCANEIIYCLMFTMIYLCLLH